MCSFFVVPQSNPTALCSRATSISSASPLPVEARRNITILAHLPDTPRSLLEDLKGNVWVGTFSKGAFLVPGTVPTTRDPPIHLWAPDEHPSTGPAGVALVNNAIAVFTSKGVELYTSASDRGMPTEIAPTTPVIAISNRDSVGSVWVAFESPFVDGPRECRYRRITFLLMQSAQSPGQPCAVPGLTQIGEIKSLFVDSRGIVWLGATDGLLRLDP